MKRKNPATSLFTNGSKKQKFPDEILNMILSKINKSDLFNIFLINNDMYRKSKRLSFWRLFAKREFSEVRTMNIIKACLSEHPLYFRRFSREKGIQLKLGDVSGKKYYSPRLDKFRDFEVAKWDPDLRNFDTSRWENLFDVENGKVITFKTESDRKYLDRMYGKVILSHKKDDTKDTKIKLTCYHIMRESEGISKYSKVYTSSQLTIYVQDGYDPSNGYEYDESIIKSHYEITDPNDYSSKNIDWNGDSWTDYYSSKTYFLMENLS